MSTRTLIWLDGVQTSTLPLPDRGLNFGDGLFETLLFKQGTPLFIELHLDRLRRGLSVLAMPNSILPARRYLELAAAEIRQFGWSWTVVRLTVTRGGGPRGYAPQDSASVRIVIEASQLDRDCAQMNSPASLCVADIRLSLQPVFAGIKHLNRLEQVMAAGYGQAMGVDECVMLDQNEQVISVVAGNLFLVRQGKLLTPRLMASGVEGTRRRLIIEKWGPSLGLDVHESRLTLSDLDSAEEVFYSNTLQGVRPVEVLGERTWSTQKVCAELFEHYLEDVA